MLKISREDKRFNRLDTPTLAAASILERSDLQEYIANSPEAFFAELGETLFILDKEVQPSDTVQDRIDLLAIDKSGRAVVIELKRGNDRLQLLQAIAYAGMVAKWPPQELVRRAAHRADLLKDFLDVEVAELNRTQRILLVAEAYDYEILVAAEWLYEQYSVDVTCARVALAVDSASGAEYLACNQVFPAKELADEAISRTRRERTGGGAEWSNWDEALAEVKNDAIVQFYKTEVDHGRESNLAVRGLYFRIGGKRRFSLEARQNSVYVWQSGRFDGDVAFWRERLSDSGSVEPKSDGEHLRFLLSTPEDFAAFVSAQLRLEGVNWIRFAPERGEQAASAADPSG